MALGELVLKKSSHKKREQGVCLLEAVAWLAGEPHSDHPTCACPVVSAFARRLNDLLDNASRRRLREFIPAIVGSRGTQTLEKRRGFLAADQAVRIIAPLVLDAVKQPERATELRACVPIVDRTTALAARDVSRAAADAYADAAADPISNYFARFWVVNKYE